MPGTAIPASSTFESSLWIALWLVAATPTRLPSASRRAISRPESEVLPEPGGPWITRCRPSRREQQPHHLLELGGLHVAGEGFAAKDGLDGGIAAVTVEQRARDPLQRVLLCSGGVGLARYQRRRRGDPGEARPTLEGDHAGVAVELDDLTGVLTCARIERALSVMELVLLRGIPEPIAKRPLVRLGLTQKGEQSDRLGILDELLGREFDSVKERPPDWLALAVVVVEQACRQFERRIAAMQQLVAQSLALLALGRQPA